MVELANVRGNAESEEKKPGAHLTTMHRLKGLKYSRVLLARVQAGLVSSEVATSGIERLQEFEQHELRERAFLFVIATRVSFPARLALKTTAAFECVAWQPPQ